jgi:hypothetical protein
VVVKKPHPLAHTCQFTPLLLLSLVTAAFSRTVLPACSCDGAEGRNRIESAVEGVIVIGADTLTGDEEVEASELVEVATTETPPLGGVGGDVYVALSPLAVCVGRT